MPPPFLDARAAKAASHQPRGLRHRPRRRLQPTQLSAFLAGRQLTCHLWQDGGQLPGTCRTAIGGQCYRYRQESSDPATQDLYGCWPGADEPELQCDNDLRMECCSSGDLCNAPQMPELPQAIDWAKRETLLPTPIGPPPSGQYFGLGSAFTLVASLSILGLLAIVLLLIWTRRHPACCGDQHRRNSSIDIAVVAFDAPPSPPIKVFVSPETPRRVAPLLPQSPRHPATPVIHAPQPIILSDFRLHRPLGAGHFGECWLAEYDGRAVALKLFHPDAGAWWRHEADLHSVAGLQGHPNVVVHLAVAVNTAGHRMLVTAHQERGSLLAVLAHGQRPIEPAELRRMATSLANGLAYLHADRGRKRLAVAHGNLSARSVLVADDGRCVIANFRRARVMGDEVVMAEPSDWRYAAPELLAATIVAATPEADMYAAAMLWWQMARCCAEMPGTAAVCEGYAAPFEEQLSGRAERADIRRLVCDERRRPVIPGRWLRSEVQVLRIVADIVADCLPEAVVQRLTASQVMERLAKVGESGCD